MLSVTTVYSTFSIRTFQCLLTSRYKHQTNQLPHWKIVSVLTDNSVWRASTKPAVSQSRLVKPTCRESKRFFIIYKRRVMANKSVLLQFCLRNTWSQLVILCYPLLEVPSMPSKLCILHKFYKVRNVTAIFLPKNMTNFYIYSPIRDKRSLEFKLKSEATTRFYAIANTVLRV
jgi:hypothetical protein